MNYLFFLSNLFRHVGRGARAPILVHRPCYCLEAFGGTCNVERIVVVALLEWSLGMQTTRIKGIMPKGLEVELELLGVQESVELLAAVAEIDVDQTPPCCLEIAQQVHKE